VNGGSIGRAPDNDWILPDTKRIVSGHHCEIEYRNGGYWVKDISTNGVFVNDADVPASQSGPVQLTDGDRLRLGDYEIVVSVDKRTDFLPSPSEESAAEINLDSGIGAPLDLNSLLRERRNADSGSMSMRIKVPSALRQLADVPEEDEEPPPPPGIPPESDWAMKTRPVTKQELADALARRQSRADARERSAPYHQQANTWSDLRSALQAFCRGAGVELGSLTPEAQSMLPLLAGQLLREAVVGLIDLQQSRAKSASTGHAQAPTGSNPLRTSQSVEQALQRLFESYGRLAGGPVDSMREVFVDIRDHDAASTGATAAALHEMLGQLAPASVADQFERGRSRALAPGQDPRPKYWEHYLEFYRVLTQGGADGLPHQFTEMFQRAYTKAREELRNRRRGE